jgi:hypothetical protein
MLTVRSNSIFYSGNLLHKELKLTHCRPVCRLIYLWEIELVGKDLKKESARKFYKRLIFPMRPLEEKPSRIGLITTRPPCACTSFAPTIWSIV